MSVYLLVFLTLTLSLLSNEVRGFTLSQNGFDRQQHTHEKKVQVKLHMTGQPFPFEDLVPAKDDSTTAPVQKRILEEGNGPQIEKGTTVEIEYSGTLAKSSWSVDDVLECWLKEQQGLYDVLAESFEKYDVDGGKLLDETYFTEDLLQNEFGVSNRIQCKKAIMAAKRLRTATGDFPEGTEFDSSQSRGKTFEFVLGKGKVIKAMDLCVATMRPGERAEVICRSDYGYGAEGYRSRAGEVVVPPFASLCFNIKIVES